MALSEIEKLERRYAENPQGLTFAPLAEVYRKNGEAQRALELLEPGLALHPDYIPASIVLGRCHLDLGDTEAAEKAFLHVLSLDGENVIALKALADLSERLLRFEDTERWLHALLSVDRSNDEAREQLHRVERERRQAGVPPSVQPAGAAAAVEPEPAPAFQSPVAEPPVGWVSQSSQVGGIPASRIEELEPSALSEPFDDAAGMQLEEPVRDQEEVQPLEGLVGREVDVPDKTSGEFRLETSEDIVLQSAGAGEFQVPDASQELFAGRPVEERGWSGGDVPVSPPAATEDGAAGPEREPRPEIVGWGERVQEPGRESEPAAAPKRAYAAGETGGQPVAQFLKDILSARPPAQAAPGARQASAAAGSGAPTRPAPDALSLSSVFGEEEAPGTPPAVPADGAGSGVSFDDFFGAPGATPPQRSPRAPDPKSDDLDQFHAWLQNLKR